MSKINIIFLLMIISSCSGQGNKEIQFGEKGISHKLIAFEFMRSIEDEDYSNCYDLVSERYKSDLDFEDFRFRMQMLKNLAGDEGFIHYNTTYIGATAAVDIRKLSGEKVTENIMPEYDFTVESEADSLRKNKSIWLRFENENSDKIQVINYSYHYNFRQHGVSNVRLNPFMIKKYLLIVANKEHCYTDVRGGDLNIKNQLKEIKNESLAKSTLENAIKTLNNQEAKKYEILIVGEQDYYEDILPILNIVKNKGYKFQSYFVKDINTMIAKYKERDPFPLN